VVDLNLGEHLPERRHREKGWRIVAVLTQAPQPTVEDPFAQLVIVARILGDVVVVERGRAPGAQGMWILRTAGRTVTREASVPGRQLGPSLHGPDVVAPPPPDGSHPDDDRRGHAGDGERT